MVDLDGNAPSPAGCSAMRDSAKSMGCGALTAQPPERQANCATFYTTGPNNEYGHEERGRDSLPEPSTPPMGDPVSLGCGG